MSTLVFQNPFSTRFIRPGAIPWLSTSTSLSSLLLRLCSIDNRAIICGPHGSGKSTILSHLVSIAKRQGLNVHCLRISSWLDVIGVIRLFATIHPKQSLVAIDSWELLGFLGWFLCQIADFRGVCVILTVHEVPWWNRWPVLLHMEADAKTFHQLVHKLMAKSSRSKNIKFSRAMLHDVLQRNSGNFREAFFELYDHYERQSRIKTYAG